MSIVGENVSDWLVGPIVGLKEGLIVGDKDGAPVGFTVMFVGLMEGDQV